MSGHYFLSYSRADAEEFAIRVADALAAGPPPYRVWLDRRELSAGDWDLQLQAAIESCEALLFVMTVDSVEPQSECREEWLSALHQNKPVIPLRLHADAELPFGLTRRQYIDFSGEFDAGMAQLRQTLSKLASPSGQLQALRTRREEVTRVLRRVASDAEKKRWEQRLDDLDARIAELDDQVQQDVRRAREEPAEKSEEPCDFTDSDAERVSEHDDVWAFDSEAPPPDIWFKRLRPVLHQASLYSVPTYYLDENLKVIDWNIAFELIFSDLISSIRYKHVNWFIVKLANSDDVFDHATDFTEEVRRGQLPLVDIEPLDYYCPRYGMTDSLVRFEKVASPFHDPEGRVSGWSVALMLRDIDWPKFLRDLREKLWQDKLWSLYSASYDPVLLKFPPYHELIRDIVSVLPARTCRVADLGAGSGNVTAALVEAGHRVTAVEQNLSMIDLMRNKRFHSRGVSVVKGSVEHLDIFEEGEFDAVTMMNVLYAVDDPDACLRSIARILKPGGLLSYSTTHEGTRLTRLLDSIRETLQQTRQYAEVARHYVNLRKANEAIEHSIARRFTLEEYVEWTEAAGFELLREPWHTYEDAVVVVHARKR